MYKEVLKKIQKNESLFKNITMDEEAHPLMNRQEDKFFLPASKLQKFITLISQKLKEGDIDTSVRYNTNKTIYLDSKDLDSFRDNLESIKPRFKVRIRQYKPNDQEWESTAYIELKIKTEEGITKKTRVRIYSFMISEIEEGKEIKTDGLEIINKDITKIELWKRLVAINTIIQKYGFKKQVTVEYNRRAFSGKDIRITIDDSLRYHDFRVIDGDTKKAILKSKGWEKIETPADKIKNNDYFILEVKHPGKLPKWLKEAISETKVKPVRFSKYCSAIATYLKTDNIAAPIQRQKINFNPIHVINAVSVVLKSEKLNYSKEETKYILKKYLTNKILDVLEKAADEDQLINLKDENQKKNLLDWSKTHIPNLGMRVWYLSHIGKNPELHEKHKKDMEHHGAMHKINNEINNIKFNKNLSLEEGLGHLDNADKKWKNEALSKKRLVDPNDYSNLREHLKLNDGWSWYDLGKSSCDLEGKAMGHCGTGRNGNRLFSLRKKVMRGNKEFHEPYLTFETNPDGVIVQAKGRGNEKPDKKYHGAIVPFLNSEGITGIVPSEYKPESDFQFSDLSNEDKQKVNQQKPSFDFFNSPYDKNHPAAKINSPSVKSHKELWEKYGGDMNKFSQHDANSSVKHPNHTPESLMQLANHPEADDYALGSIAKHPNHTLESLMQLANHPKTKNYILGSIAKHPNHTLESLTQLANHPEVDRYALGSIAQHPNHTPESLMQLANHPEADKYALGSIAQHPNHTPESLTQLAKHPRAGEYTLSQIAKHPNHTPESLMQLANDPRAWGLIDGE
jgi:hypothetical protein